MGKEGKRKQSFGKQGRVEEWKGRTGNREKQEPRYITYRYKFPMMNVIIMYT